MSARRPAATGERHDPAAALRALDLPAPLSEAIATLIAFGSRVGATAGTVASRSAAARGLAARLHRQLLALPTLFEGTVSGDPAFAMLLSLVADEESGRATTVSDLTRASGAPPTTALRHLDRLEERALVIRRPDAADRRRILVTLTQAGRDDMDRAMTALFAT